MLAPANGDDLEDGFQIQADFSESEEAVIVQHLIGKKKRKRNNASKEKAVKVRSMKQRYQEPETPFERQKLDVEGQGGVAAKLAAFQSPAVQTEYFNTLQAKLFPDASPLDLDEMKFQESSFVDTGDYGTNREIEKLPEFISQVTPTLKVRLGQKPANKGAPTLLFITGAALRAAEITRQLRTMRGTKGGEIAKLFAKHFKMKEQAEYLSRTLVAGGVGTAGRIGKLLGETGSISLKALTHIIVDASFRDAKTRTIFDIPETRTSLIRELFGNQALKKAIDSGKATIVLF